MGEQFSKRVLFDVHTGTILILQIKWTGELNCYHFYSYILGRRIFIRCSYITNPSREREFNFQNEEVFSVFLRIVLFTSAKFSFQAAKHHLISKAII